LNGLWSNDCINFLQVCTKKKPAERPPSEYLLKHPWLVKCGSDTNNTRLVPIIASIKKLKQEQREKELGK
jgi:hypothetical protein